MNFLWSSKTEHISRPNIPVFDKKDYTPHNLESGNISYYNGDVMEGLCMYDYLDGDYQVGQFEYQPDMVGTGFTPTKFTYGEYSVGGMKYRGHFTVNPNDQFDYLNDDFGEIEWPSGIRFNGKVEMDEPISGTYTIPDGTTIKVNGHEGVLTHQGDMWIAEFKTGPIAKIAGRDFDLMRNRFINKKTIFFTDACTFIGCEYDEDTNDVEDVFSTPPKFNGVDKWGTHQLNLWLICNKNAMTNGSHKFFDRIHKFNVTGRQFLQFAPEHFKALKMNPIVGLQLQDELNHLG